MDNGDGILTCKKTNWGSFGTFEKWLEAFLIFVAIYSSKCHNFTPSLMKHATIVQCLSKQSGDNAALYYDESFRMWRQDNPEYLPWRQINTELQNEALAMGISRKKYQPFQGKTKQPLKKPCFQFNNNNCRCTRPKCPFEHKCQKCGGPHSKKQCPKHLSTRIFTDQTRKKEYKYMSLPKSLDHDLFFL